jgi:hypothetical protein
LASPNQEVQSQRGLSLHFSRRILGTRSDPTHALFPHTLGERHFPKDTLALLERGESMSGSQDPAKAPLLFIVVLKGKYKLNVVVYNCNPNTWKVEAGGLRV